MLNDTWCKDSPESDSYLTNSESPLASPSLRLIVRAKTGGVRIGGPAPTLTSPAAKATVPTNASAAATPGQAPAGLGADPNSTSSRLRRRSPTLRRRRYHHHASRTLKSYQAAAAVHAAGDDSRGTVTRISTNIAITLR